MVLHTAYKLTLKVNKPNFTNLLLTIKNTNRNTGYDNKACEKAGTTTLLGLQIDNSLNCKIFLNRVQHNLL
jgi:hypothetical protein